MKEKFEEIIQKIQQMENSDPKKRLNAFIEEVILFTNSKIGYFATINDKEDILTMIGWSNSAMSNCAMMDKPIIYPVEETGLWGDAVRERQAVVTNDYENCEKPTKKGYPDGHVDVVRHLNIPVWEGDHIVGVLGVGNKETNYNQDDIDLMSEFSQKLWSVIKEGII